MGLFAIGWTKSGHLELVNVTDQYRIVSICFHEAVSINTRVEKLELVAQIINMAINCPEMTEEDLPEETSKAN